MTDELALRTVVVDDETLSREKAVRYLKEYECIELVAEATSAAEARSVILARRPHLVMLDIRLPDIDGLTMAEDLRHTLGAETPLFIIATAYDSFALRAFDVHAVDYLLKPYSRERFKNAVLQARTRLSLKRSSRSETSEATARQATQASRITIRTSNKLLLFERREIIYLRAAGNYVEVHTAGGTHLIRAKLGDLEEQLNGDMFFHIHRSIIVNARYLREVNMGAEGRDAAIVLNDGRKLPLTRTFRSDVLKRLQRGSPNRY